MPKKFTLMDYSRTRHRQHENPDKHIIRFLKKQRPGRVLFIGSSMSAYYAAKKGYKVVVVDTDLRAIKEGKAHNPGAQHEYTDFMQYAKRSKKDSFDLIIDKAYSNSIRRGSVRKFYQEIAKLLRYNGTLFIKSLSTRDVYCKEHCPKRHWTHIGAQYVNFFTKAQLQRLVLSNMKINSYSLEKHAEDTTRTYHLVVATLKVRKF